MSEAVTKLADVGGEVLVDESFVGEVDDEGFVVAVRGLDQVQRGCVNGGTLVPHRTRIIDDDAHRYWDVLVLEGRDGLRDAVFKYLEVVLLEVGHQMAAFVEYRDVENHLIHVALQGETAMRSALQGLGAAIGRAGVVGADRLIVLGVGGEDRVAVYIQ